jgi:hypothetical protein
MRCTMLNRSSVMIVRPTLNRVQNAVSVPWNAFVAAFLYYTLLAVLMLGGGRFGAPAVAGAYAMPALAYGVTVAVRLVRAAAGRFRTSSAPALTGAAHCPG